MPQTAPEPGDKLQRPGNIANCAARHNRARQTTENRSMTLNPTDC